MSARTKAWKAFRNLSGKGSGGDWGAWVEMPLDDRARAAVEITHGRKFVWAKQNNMLVAYLYLWPETQIQDRPMVQLVLFRTDGKSGIEWKHKQQAKTELLGAEVEAVELFPAESRLIDGDHQYHLWVDPSYTRFDFGYFERGRVVFTEEQRLASHAALKKVLG